jgi:hypothetical protein
VGENENFMRRLGMRERVGERDFRVLAEEVRVWEKIN